MNIKKPWNNNIIFEKIWIDENPFDNIFQARITVSNDNIVMSTEIYMQPYHIHKMISGIPNLLNCPYFSILGNNDDSYIDCVIFNFYRSSKQGTIGIDVYMKSCYAIDPDQKATNDTANFHLSTDISSLDEFSNNLCKFIDGDIGTKVSLHVVLPE